MFGAIFISTVIFVAVGQVATVGKRFYVLAKVNNNVVGKGTGKTKKDAEMEAAREALLLFGVAL